MGIHIIRIICFICKIRTICIYLSYLYSHIYYMHYLHYMHYLSCMHLFVLFVLFYIYIYTYVLYALFVFVLIYGLYAVFVLIIYVLYVWRIIVIPRKNKREALHKHREATEIKDPLSGASGAGRGSHENRAKKARGNRGKAKEGKIILFDYVYLLCQLYTVLVVLCIQFVCRSARSWDAFWKCLPFLAAPTQASGPLTIQLADGDTCPDGSAGLSMNECETNAARIHLPDQKAGIWISTGSFSLMPPGCVSYSGFKGTVWESNVVYKTDTSCNNDGSRKIVCQAIPVSFLGTDLFVDFQQCFGALFNHLGILSASLFRICSV